MSAPERTRTVVNVAGSIRRGAKASRHRMEFAAKHSIAVAASAIVRDVIWPGTDPRGTLELGGSDMFSQPDRVVSDTRQK